MTEHNHDEIARRLRETGTVQAPDQLREDVMSQVRTEPRKRPSRRRFFAPILPYAAAAAALVGLVLAFAHLGGGGSSSSSAGGGGAGGGVSHAPEKSLAGEDQGAGTQPARFSIVRSQALKLADEPKVTATRAAPGVIVLSVPRSLYRDYKARLGRIERHTPEGPTIRVILRRVP